MTRDIFRFVMESSIDASLFEKYDDDIPSPRFSNESKISICGVCVINSEVAQIEKYRLDNFRPIKYNLTTPESSIRGEQQFLNCGRK